MPYQAFDGPIPGENFTADTKNFPWHRPPQFTNLDDCIEEVISKVMDEEAADSFLTMIELGFTICDLAQVLVQSGIGAGMWTTDMGILLAGPVAHILVIMCRGYDLEFDLGVEPTDHTPTSVFFKAASKIDPEKTKAIAEESFGAAQSANDPQNAGPPEDNIPQAPSSEPTNAQPNPPPPTTGLGGNPLTQG